MSSRRLGTGVEPLVHEICPTAAELELRKRYLEFDAEDERRLRQLHDLVAGSAEPVIEAFYRHLLSFPETSAFFSGPDEVEHVKRAQVRYFQRLTRGPHDLSYAEDRLRIGAVHERVGLEVKYYLGSYCRYLRELLRPLATAPLDSDDRQATFDSLLKVVFLDIGLAIDAYVLRRERELQAAISELETFNYSVSHDLRAPLRAIIGFSEALLEDSGEELDEEARAHLRFIAQGGRRMSQLVEALLTLSRISRAEMIAQPVSISETAAAVAEPLMTANHRSVELRIQPGIWTTGDARLVSVLLQNLLGNAFKFTSRHQTALIEVGLQQREGEPVVYVRDDGAGFDMANADRLFGVFQRLHPESEFEGTGTGLATAMRIVRRHGGRIWAEGALDRGATLYFTLPDLRVDE
ncbi:MAG TPA: protoglobin domain-containing protein [Candidatus Dormibacteraeota bacterium]|jgi:signal transduction histidine kinase